MKLPALRGQLTQQMGQVHQVLGDQVAHLAGLAGEVIHIPLPHAVHRQQACSQGLGALLFAQAFPHNHIHAAGLVFQRDENNPFGGGRLLARGNDAAGAYQPTAVQVVHLGSGEEPHF